jgi:hypothetical protein
MYKTNILHDSLRLSLFPVICFATSCQTLSCKQHCHVIECDYRQRFGLVIGFIDTYSRNYK